MIFRTISVVGMCFLLGATVVGGQQETKRQRKLEVTQLTFQGVKAIELGELEQNLAISQSQCVSLILKPICTFSKSPLFYKKAYLDRDELARDMLRAQVLYYKHGYRQTTVDTLITPDGKAAVHVLITINEGMPTEIVAVNVRQPDSLMRARTIRHFVTLQPGEPFDLFDLDTARAGMKTWLEGRGYVDGTVDTATVVDSTGLKAWVTIIVDPKWKAKVASIAVEGNKGVSDSTILKSLSFKQGETYTLPKVLSSQRALYESNLFRRASIETQPTDDSLKHVSVVVREAPPRDAQVSVGFNTVNFFQVGGQFTDYNWFGNAQKLNLQATVGNLLASSLNGAGIFYDVGKTVVGGSASTYLAPTFTVSAQVQRPWFLSPDNSIAMSVFAHRQSAPGIYIDKGYGASATFTRNLTDRAPLSFNYRFEETNVDAGDVYFCVDNGVCDQSTLAALRKNQRLSPVSITASIDRTNDPLEPRRGMRGEVDLEAATAFTASDFRYGRGSVDAAAFLPVVRRSTIGFHIRLGYVNAFASTAEAVGISDGTDPDILHPRKRFYAGGAQSVRGFGEGQLGPRVLTIPASKLRQDTVGCPPSLPIQECNPNSAVFSDGDFEARPLGGNVLVEGSVEFRFPLFGNFIGATFVDAGYVAQNTNPDVQKSKAAITPGFGVRYKSIAGPIRVDVGINPVTTEKLEVVTNSDVGDQQTLVTLDQPRDYSPSQGGWSAILSRLTLHLSIGEAF